MSKNKNILYKNNLPTKPGQYLWKSSRVKDSSVHLITVEKYPPSSWGGVKFAGYLGVSSWGGRSIEVLKNDYFSDSIEFTIKGQKTS